MAEQYAAVEDHLTCPVCLETCKEPVSLGCNHSFCSDCLKGFWDQRQSKDCPVCRRKSSKEAFVNFALRQLCVSLGDKPGSSVRAGACVSHPQVQSVFCKDEAQLLCPLCELSQHREHTVVSVEDAETELKQRLSSELQSLKKSRERAQTVEQAYRDCQTHTRSQAELCEEAITAQFERLHCFLRAEEELRLSELRLEQKSRAQKLELELATVTHTLASLQEHIQTLENLLQKHTEDFIVSYSPSQSYEDALQPLPPLGPDLLIDQAKVLGNLGFRIWRKMRGVVQFRPVVLDPNTAQPLLHVSEDMAFVKRVEKMKLPENPERFMMNACVLGSEGFRSGTHQWDVEVGDHPCWTIGVLKESVNRREKLKSTPENVVWAITFTNNEYISSLGTLTMKQNPQRIRVQLDFEKGTVSFYDSGDMFLIHSYKDKFTEKLFPFFSVAPSNVDCQSKELRICPVPV